MRAPAAILLIESSVLGLKTTLLELADELPPGTPAPTASVRGASRGFSLF